MEPIGLLLPAASIQGSTTVESTCKRLLSQAHLPHPSATALESVAVVLFRVADAKDEREGSVQLEAYHVDLVTFQKSPLLVEVILMTEWMSRELVSVSLKGSLSVDIRLCQLTGILTQQICTVTCTHTHTQELGT